MDLLNISGLKTHLLNWLNTHYYRKHDANYVEIQQLTIEYDPDVDEAYNCIIKIRYGRCYDDLDNTKSELNEHAEIEISCEPELLDNKDYVLGLFAASVHDK